MTQEKVLIISLGSMRDAIYTLPLIATLKRNEYIINVLTTEKSFEIFSGNPYVKHVQPIPLEQWLQKMPYWGIFEDMGEAIEKIKKKNFDIVIDCEQSFRSLFLLANSGIKRRLTYSNAKGFSSFGGNEFIDNNPKLKNYNVHQLEKNLNFARYLDLDTSIIDFTLPEINYHAKIKVDKFFNVFKENRPLIVLAPNSALGETSWHPKNWINLVNNINTTYNIVVLGKFEDKALAAKMSHPNLLNLCNQTDFNDLRYILNNSKVVISNNLEVSTIAWAMKKIKVITISTNLPPAKYNPYNLNNDGNYKTLSGNLACQYCEQKQCPNGSYKCTHTPTVETILNEI